MKKIYWHIQQLDKIGGTEEVSIVLMNALAKYYDVTLICTSRISDKICYSIDKNISIFNLELPNDISRYDQYSYKYLKGFHLLKFLNLTFRLLKYYLFRRRKYRNLIENLVEEDAIYIASSLDSYLFAPKNRKVLFHFHFDAKSFLAPFFQIVLKMCVKPEKYIFLSKSIKDAVLKKKPELDAKSLYMYNPSRFEREENFTYKGSRIIFVGRYAKQKNPILALKVADELKKLNTKFKLDMFGQGSLEPEMRKYVSTHHLEDVVSINKPKINIKDEIRNSDLILLTSLYEGIVLVKLEGNSLSIPVITSCKSESLLEVSVNNKDGILIEDDDEKKYAKAIKELLEDREKLESLKKSTYELSTRFEIDNIVEKWVNYIESI